LAEGPALGRSSRPGADPALRRWVFPPWEGRAGAFAPGDNTLRHSNPRARAISVGDASGHVSAPLPDNHDIISLKLFQLTVERTPEEEKHDREVYLPVVDNLKLPGCE